MTKQTRQLTRQPVTTPEDKRRSQQPAPAPVPPRPDSPHRHGVSTALVVAGVVALLVAIAFATWSLTQQATPEIAPSAHDGLIDQLVRERHRTFTEQPLDPAIQRLVDERYDSFNERPYDPAIDRLLREREAALVGHDAWIDRILRGDEPGG